MCHARPFASTFYRPAYGLIGQKGLMFIVYCNKPSTKIEITVTTNIISAADAAAAITTTATTTVITTTTSTITTTTAIYSSSFSPPLSIIWLDGLGKS